MINIGNDPSAIHDLLNCRDFQSLISLYGLTLKPYAIRLTPTLHAGLTSLELGYHYNEILEGGELPVG